MTFNYRGMTLWPCTLVQGRVRPFPTTPEMLHARSLLRRKGGFVGMTPTAETAVPEFFRDSERSLEITTALARRE